MGEGEASLRTITHWLEKHVGAIQAVTAIVTVLLALSALVGVKLQIDASARLQREQSARDIYREFLSLSISKPEFAAPQYCAIIGSPAEAAYESYVEYMLYTAEQSISANPDWQPVFETTMIAHRDYLCTISEWSGYSGEVEEMGRAFKAKQCATPVVCKGAAEGEP